MVAPTSAAVTQAIRRAAQAIHDANSLVITAGAGMGVDSGLPDFRGKEGFWKAYPLAMPIRLQSPQPMKHLGLDLPSMSNPAWFVRDPALAWGFFGHRLQLYSKTEPHDGFKALLKWAEEKEQYFVFTSNVDGHFQKAGFPESRIIECHGSIEWLQCTNRMRCKKTYRQAPIWKAADDKDLAALKVDPTTFRASEPLPKCIYECGQLARPNILMFSDNMWDDDRHFSQDNAFQKYLNNIGAAKVVVIELGAGLSVPTVRMQGEDIASDTMGTLIRINTTDADVPSSRMDAISIPLGALEALKMIDKELELLA